MRLGSGVCLTPIPQVANFEHARSIQDGHEPLFDARRHCRCERAKSTTPHDWPEVGLQDRKVGEADQCVAIEVTVEPCAGLAGQAAAASTVARIAPFSSSRAAGGGDQTPGQKAVDERGKEPARREHQDHNDGPHKDSVDQPLQGFPPLRDRCREL